MNINNEKKTLGQSIESIRQNKKLDEGLIIGIDASNIRAGGGITHLCELLRIADPLIHGFSKIIVWSGKATLNKLEDRPWLLKRKESFLDKNLFYRSFWQRFRLSKLTRAAGCDVLYVPGGSYYGNFRPVVAFSQNLLPFEWQESLRYGWSWNVLKFMLLRWTQSHTFKKADGVIFLTQYSKDIVMRLIKDVYGKTSIVPHGINRQFVCTPRKQLAVAQYSFSRPFRILYVSIIEVYKHQWHVVDAVRQLREIGLPVVLDLVGPATPIALKRLSIKLEQVDPKGEFIRYEGKVPYSKLNACYGKADVFVFASSCEAFGQILLEAMSAGLPIACSNKSSMPSVLGDAGIYFDPENPEEIANAIKKLFDNPELRFQLACGAFDKVKEYTWSRCAKTTFSFISQVATKNQDVHS